MEELMDGCVELIVELLRANGRWDYVVWHEVGKAHNGSVGVGYNAGT